LAAGGLERRGEVGQGAVVFNFVSGSGMQRRTKKKGKEWWRRRGRTARVFRGISIWLGEEMRR
jgi:hypothetical protein